MQLNGYTLKCDYTVSEALGSILLWIVLIFLTLGLAMFVMPYYILKGPINRTHLLDASGNKVGSLHVDVNFSEILGHAAIWFVLTIITLGLALFVYYPAVVKRLLSGVKIG